MGSRKSGDANVHTDRDQVDDIERVVPPGDALEILEPELDVSGGLPLSRRPSLRVAVEGVEAGRYCGIIVAYQSRLMRDVEEEEAVWRRVEDAGGEVKLALEPFDTKTPAGRLTRRIKAAFNAGEREEHVVKFDRRRRVAIESGIWKQRQTPTGYVRDPETRHLVIDLEGKRLVLDAARWLLAGESVTSISKRIGMTPSGTRHMLRNRVYLGELTEGPYTNPAAHPPIMDEQLFEEVQAELDTRATSRPARSVKHPTALLAGIVRCAACGHRMTRRSGKGSLVYVCTRLHSGEHCPEPTAIATARLDAYVEPIAKAELARVVAAAAATDRVGELRQVVERAKRRRDGLLDTFDADDVGAEALADAVRRASVEVSDAEAELREEIRRAAAIPTATRGDVVYDDLTAHERNTLLRNLLAAVVVRRAGRGPNIPVSERALVIAYGTPLALPRSRGGHLTRTPNIVPIPFNPDGPGVLRMLDGEDPL